MASEIVKMGAMKVKGTVNLYLMRHGKTVLNTLDRVQGWGDSPLTEEGVEVAKDVAYGLAEMRFDFVYTSDKLRARETAALVMAVNPSLQDKKMIRLKELREANFGKYEGGSGKRMLDDTVETLGLPSMEEFRRLEREEGRGKFFEALLKNDESGRAESEAALTERLLKAVEMIIGEAQKKENANVLIVSHGFAICMLIQALTGEHVGYLANASISHIRCKDGEARLMIGSDESYCAKGAAVRKEKREQRTLGNLYVMCAGKTVQQAEGLLEGWTDSDLSEEGIQDVEKRANKVSDILFQAVYTSDFCSTIETADIVLRKNKATKSVERIERKGLRNVSYGQFELQVKSDILLNQEEQVNRFYEMDETRKAEHWIQFTERVSKELAAITQEAEKNGGGNILVVSHEIAIGAMKQIFSPITIIS